MTREELIKKYNVPAPRYTSYPTVPYWDAVQSEPQQWLDVVAKTFAETNDTLGISLYIHLPFCESHCTYCACNKLITKSHAVEEPYIEAVLKEWKMYLDAFGGTPNLRELHLGGGTPTFFSPQNLERLLSTILAGANLHPKHEFSFEGHPNNTTYEHLTTLYNLGFRRVSYGVQDLDESVQRIINRIQPFETVERVTNEARQIGYTSVNFDLVYGLPRQQIKNVEYTIEQVSKLMPDRIAFYSYAHVPWLKTGQRKFTDADLPTDAEKRALYEIGKQKLMAIGLMDVGMDHFAKPNDQLFIALNEKRLHRNFMGYTTSQSQLLIGLGASSISDAKYAFAQNEKEVNQYREVITETGYPVTRVHFQTDEDLIIRQAILSISCHGELYLSDALKNVLPTQAMETLYQMVSENIIEFDGTHLKLTPDFGKMFLRNVCMAFDARLHRKQKSDKPMFSKAI